MQLQIVLGELGLCVCIEHGNNYDLSRSDNWTLERFKFKSLFFVFWFWS